MYFLFLNKKQDWISPGAMLHNWVGKCEARGKGETKGLTGFSENVYFWSYILGRYQNNSTFLPKKDKKPLIFKDNFPQPQPY